MFTVVTSVLVLGVIVLFIYVAPTMVKKILPDLEAEAKQTNLAYKTAIDKFEKIYNKKVYTVSKSKYEEYENTGNVSAEIKAARKISVQDNGDSKFIDIFNFISKLQIEDKKVEFILKLLPYVIGIVLTGFLVTYRLHISAAKELAIKKIDVLSSFHVNITDNS